MSENCSYQGAIGSAQQSAGYANSMYQNGQAMGANQLNQYQVPNSNLRIAALEADKAILTARMLELQSANAALTAQHTVMQHRMIELMAQLLATRAPASVDDTKPGIPARALFCRPQSIGLRTI